METQSNKVEVHIDNYTGSKPVEVIFREGVAGKALDEKAPLSIDVTGVITNPVSWLEKRVDLIDQHNANVLVERDEMKITLTVNEDEPYLKAQIIGKAEFSKIFIDFGINDPQKGWTPAKLGQFLRLNRALFNDKEECMKLVSSLKNFTAKAKSEIEKQRDPSGSRADVYRTQVESNLPKSFTICLPIFKGKEKTTIDVEFDHYLSEGEVFLQLVSPGAKEMADEWKDRVIDDEIRKIRELAPDIAILEA